MIYKIKYLESVISRDIVALPKGLKTAIRRAIEERLLKDPIAFGKPLRYGLHGQRSLRVSVYRIIYTVDHENSIVTIVAIGHRRNIYKP